MLLKVAANQENRSRILELVQILRIKVVDVADDALTLAVLGDPDKPLALEQVLEPFGILQIVRTGKIFLGRASGINTEFLKVKCPAEADADLRLGMVGFPRLRSLPHG